MKVRSLSPLLLVLLLSGLLITPVLVLAQSDTTGDNIDVAPSPDTPEVTVTGHNDPDLDYDALSAALASTQPGDTLNLEGIFNLSKCGDPLTLDKNITVSGTSDPNDDPATAAQLYGCGPAFIVNNPNSAAGALTIQNIYFRNQAILSIEFRQSVNPVNILNNRFTGVVPADLNGTNARFAVGVAAIGPFNVEGSFLIEGNLIDWSDYPHNDTFYGDDNGFAFAAADVSVIIRNNSITTLGEAVEIEGNFGQDNTYLVEGNIIHTTVPPSTPGTSSGPPGSVAEGKEGGHPAVIKPIANEGTFIVRNNDVTLSGLPNGVCIMATTLNDKALAGQLVNVIENNKCHLDGQLTALLGAWGQTHPFFDAASLSGAMVSGNIISGNGSVGIAMVSRTLVSENVGSIVNTGHSNIFMDNDFSNFTAENADIGLDPQTYDNYIMARPNDNVVDLGQNFVLNQMHLMPLVANE